MAEKRVAVPDEYHPLPIRSAVIYKPICFPDTKGHFTFFHVPPSLPSFEFIQRTDRKRGYKRKKGLEELEESNRTSQSGLRQPEGLFKAVTIDLLLCEWRSAPDLNEGHTHETTRRLGR